jgi:hypothetical protein
VADLRCHLHTFSLACLLTYHSRSFPLGVYDSAEKNPRITLHFRDGANKRTTYFEPIITCFAWSPVLFASWLIRAYSTAQVSGIVSKERVKGRACCEDLSLGKDMSHTYITTFSRAYLHLQACCAHCRPSGTFSPPSQSPKVPLHRIKASRVTVY